jgi:hypothetical protein
MREGNIPLSIGKEKEMNNYQVGSKVCLNYTHDEFDRPIEHYMMFTVTRINTTEKVPHRGWDYEITGDKSGSTFYVLEGEIFPAEMLVTEFDLLPLDEEIEEESIARLEFETEQQLVRRGVQL